MPPKKQSASQQPAATKPVDMTAEMAELLNRKIREFEQSNLEEHEKAQKAQKGRVKAQAKNKLKEVKQLVSNPEIPAEEKVQQLWAKLQEEHEQATSYVEEATARLKEIIQAETEREANQVELARTNAVKLRLDALSRQLKEKVAELAEDRRRITEAERLKRQALADEFQQTITDVKKEMDFQASERTRLARENEELRARFKSFFETYDRREKELQDDAKNQEEETRNFEQRLTEQVELFKAEATREFLAKKDHDELTASEKALRQQLQTYTSKFSSFQDALSKSDKILGQYKRQKGKMQRKVETLEKDNAELKLRNQRRLAQVTKERDALVKEKTELQERCKALTAERQRLQSQAGSK